MSRPVYTVNKGSESLMHREPQQRAASPVSPELRASDTPPESSDSSLASLPGELLERIAQALPPNEVACVLRPLCRSFAAHFRSHAAVRLSQPVPHNAFVLRFGSWSGLRSLPLAQRRQLLCLTAASGCVDNLHVLAGGPGVAQAVGTAGCALTADVFAAAAKAGHVRVCEALLQLGCPWTMDTVLVAAGAGHAAVVELLVQAGCPWDFVDVLTAGALSGSVATVAAVMQLFSTVGERSSGGYLEFESMSGDSEDEEEDDDDDEDEDEKEEEAEGEAGGRGEGEAAEGDARSDGLQGELQGPAAAQQDSPRHPAHAQHPQQLPRPAPAFPDQPRPIRLNNSELSRLVAAAAYGLPLSQMQELLQRCANHEPRCLRHAELALACAVVSPLPGWRETAQWAHTLLRQWHGGLYGGDCRAAGGGGAAEATCVECGDCLSDMHVELRPLSGPQMRERLEWLRDRGCAPDVIDDVMLLPLEDAAVMEMVVRPNLENKTARECPEFTFTCIIRTIIEWQLAEKGHLGTLQAMHALLMSKPHTASVTREEQAWIRENKCDLGPDAARKGHGGLRSWVLSAVAGAARKRQLHVMRWALDTFGAEFSPRHLWWLWCCGPSLPLPQLLAERGLGDKLAQAVCTESDLVLAVGSGCNVAWLEQARTQHGARPVASTLAAVAARGDAKPLLEWCVQHGGGGGDDRQLLLHESPARAAVQAGCVQAVEWLLARDCPLPDRFCYNLPHVGASGALGEDDSVGRSSPLQLLAAIAAHKGDVGTLAALHACRGPRPTFFASDETTLRLAVLACSLPVLQLLPTAGDAGGEAGWEVSGSVWRALGRAVRQMREREAELDDDEGKAGLSSAFCAWVEAACELSDKAVELSDDRAAAWSALGGWAAAGGDQGQGVAVEWRGGEERTGGSSGTAGEAEGATAEVRGGGCSNLEGNGGSSIQECGHQVHWDMHLGEAAEQLAAAEVAAWQRLRDKVAEVRVWQPDYRHH